jgi:site-specific DNA recombinase
MLQCLIARIEVRRETVEIWIRPSAIPSIVGSRFDPARSPIADESEPKLIVSIPARLKRTGRETKLLIDGGGPRREPDRSLLRLIARAQRFSLMVMQGEGRTISELAGQSGVSPSYFTRILRLSFLAPDIVSAIVSDRHPLELTAKRISLTHRLPNAWSEQKALLGMA